MGKIETDPVIALHLPGDLVGAIACPWMINRGRGKPKQCGEQAMLYRYPDPYGYRSRCEDDHWVVLGPRSVPGLWRPLKGATD